MDQLHHEAIELLDRVRAYCDKPNEPASGHLRQEAQRLIDMFEMHLNARDLENQANRIEQIVHGMSDAEMDYNDRDDIKDRCHEMAMGLRKFR